jgi:SAM-dependent methyltransferase
MKFRYTFSVLRMLKIPGLLRFVRDWQAFMRMQFLFAGYESGLLSALSSACSREALIEKLGVKRPDLLDALLDMGQAVGELGRREGVYFIKGKRSRAIMGDKGDILVAMIQANVTYYSDAYRHAAGRLRGEALGDDLEKIGDVVARFSKGVEFLIKKFVSYVASGKNPLRVLDVGCGSGIHLKSIYEVNLYATGLGLEIDPVVVRQAKENIVAWGLTERFDIFHGDIRNPPEEVSGPFDLVTLYNILYYFEEKDRRKLLEKTHDMLSPRGVLAVVMNFHSEGRDLTAANLNVVNCSLKGLTPVPGLEETTLLLKQCGFGKIETHRFLPGGTFCGIVAEKS